jgi:hypothetical protein
MRNISSNLPTEKRIKERAKKISKEKGIKQTQALEIVSQELGFSSWIQCKEVLKKNELTKTPTPDPSLKFVEDNDVVMNEDDYDLFDHERGRDFNDDEKEQLLDNKRSLTKLGIEFSVFEPTKTGFKKSILDATQSVRTHFEIENFHFYWEQGQGPEYKVLRNASLLTNEKTIQSTASLYRPKTKKGDPRMWFRKLSEFSVAGDQVAIIIKEKSIFLINLSTTSIQKSINNNESLIGQFLNSLTNQHNSIADELLRKLKDIAKSPFPSLRQGDTGIGYSLEALLGIAANSSKLPDYKGIELKSGRGAKTRATLFAQVADWDISPCKKSAEILNKYGYERENDFKLNCTISTQRKNSQGLSFIYDQAKDQLQEWHENTNLVAIWPGEILRKRLKEKHSETFWVEAKSSNIDGLEHFQLLKVTHTKSPLISQFIPLVQSGVITMDHLIKRDGKNNRVSERGPLFKMNKRDLDLLFPEPVTYSLV